MARSAPMWWPWVQMRLDERRWIPADLAREIRKLGFVGPDESAIGRWKNHGATPSRESVRAVTTVFGCDRDGVRKAKIAAGLVTADDLDAPWPDLRRLGAPWIDFSEINLREVPDEALIELQKELVDEVTARLLRRAARPLQPATTTVNGTNHATTATTTGGASRHIIPAAETESAPPSFGEDEGTGLSIDAGHCA